MTSRCGGFSRRPCDRTRRYPEGCLATIRQVCVVSIEPLSAGRLDLSLERGSVPRTSETPIDGSANGKAACTPRQALCWHRLPKEAFGSYRLEGPKKQDGLGGGVMPEVPLDDVLAS